jgi:phage terminase large subunit-like protein
VWYQQGFLNATEGNVIHYDFIGKFIENLGEKYHILEIALDRWGATQMAWDLRSCHSNRVLGICLRQPRSFINSSWKENLNEYEIHLEEVVKLGYNMTTK